MTALELWKSNPDDQKIAETFFKGDTGQRLLAVLVERNQPAASTLLGLDGIHEDSKGLQRWEGWQRCLAFIPTLFHSALRAQHGQQAAREKLEENRKMHLAVTTPGPNHP